MNFLAAVIGGILGAILWNTDEFAGFLIGGALAVLIRYAVKQSKRLGELESELEGLRIVQRVRLPDAAAAHEPAPIHEPAPPPELPVAEPAQPAWSAPAASPKRAVFQIDEQTPVPARAPDLPAFKLPSKGGQQAQPQAQVAPRPHITSAPPASAGAPGVERQLLAFFTGGNWPVKVGVLLLFAGVAALLKYAIENELLVLPIELRLLGIAALGVFALGFGFRSSAKRRTFGLSMQGLGLGVIALTTYAAYARFGLLSTEICLALVIICIGIAVALALIEDALALAWLAAFGAFLAPWIAQVKDAPGALFGYYLVVNIGVLLIALKKDWRSLNLLAYVATFLFGSIWGAQFYTPAYLAQTEPFLLLHGALFVFIGFWFAKRGPDEGLGRIETTLVFGAPLAVLLLQGLMLTDQPEALGLRAFGIGIVHGLLAYWLFRGKRLVTLRRCYTAIAAAFITLAVPLSFSAPTTALVFSLQSLAVMWLAVGEGRSRLLRYVSAALYALALPAYAIGFAFKENDVALLNGPAFGALALTLAGLGNAWLLSRAIAKVWPVPATPRFAALAFFTIATLALQIGGIAQIERFAQGPGFTYLLLLLAAFGTGLGALLARGLAWPLARRMAELNLPLLLVTTAMIVFQSLPMFADYRGLGWIAWSLAIVVALRLRAAEDGSMCTAMRFVFPLLWLLIVSIELARKCEIWGFPDSLSLSIVAAPMLVLLAALLAIPGWLDRLYGRDGEQMNALLSSLLSALSIVLVLIACFFDGNPAPLGFVPILNPLELTIIGALALIWFGLRERMRREALQTLLLVLGFIALSAAALRWTHQLFAEPWGAGLLGSMRAQSALSIVWTLAGVGGMLVGAHLGRRRPWQLGAAVMALVLLKLALIDRSFLGNLPGIVAFLVVGGLLVVVGYFAPQPPAVEKR